MPGEKESVVYAQDLDNGGVYNLVKTDIDIKEPLLDICVANETTAFGCGEFGLREYELDENRTVKGEFSLIGNFDFLTFFR